TVIVVVEPVVALDKGRATAKGRNKDTSDAGVLDDISSDGSVDGTPGIVLVVPASRRVVGHGEHRKEVFPTRAADSVVVGLKGVPVRVAPPRTGTPFNPTTTES